MAASRSKSARKLSFGPLEVEHLGLCRARQHGSVVLYVALEIKNSTLKYLYNFNIFQTPRGRTVCRMWAVLVGSGRALRGGIGSEFDKTTSQVHSP